MTTKPGGGGTKGLSGLSTKKNFFVASLIQRWKNLKIVWVAILPSHEEIAQHCQIVGQILSKMSKFVEKYGQICPRGGKIC